MKLRPILASALLVFPTLTSAQTAGITLGGSGFDSELPIEVTSDSLSLDQAGGEAVFSGNVLVVQGDVRMSASRIVVDYGEAGISRMNATGGVTFVTPTEAAEAAEAVYDVAEREVVLSGNVLLTQGATSIAGDRLVFDLESGSGRMEGRVRTILGGSN